MTVIINKSTDKASLQQLMVKLPKGKRFNSSKHCGKLKFKKSPMDIQKIMRDEWE